MGYYSDVRIKTTKKGFEALKIEIEKYNKENNIKYSALDTAKTETYEDIVTLTWYNEKWYEGYEDVEAIKSALSKIQEQGYSWTYARIGENYDDIETEYNVQDDDLWEDLDIPIRREFED